MSNKLLQGFGALYRLLDRPKAARLVVFGLLAIHTGLLAYSAYVHSPTLNEPGHLVAGLSHWKFGRFEVYRVNPPLVKMIAALPVILAGYEEDWSGFYEGPGARPEMAMGEDFVAANGERSFFLFMIARWACIPLSWIGAITCFLWARDLYGRPSGVMACAIWCFEPNILAHASLMTPDIGGTALGVAACYTFWKWLKNPTWAQAALTGVVLGLAELSKTTLILFYPLWPLLWVIYRWPDRAKMVAVDWLREAGMLALRMVIGLYILNLGYGFEGSGTRLKDFHFVSNLFAGRETQVESQEPDDSQTNSSFPSRREPSSQSTNRFANSWLGNLPTPLPKNYMLGIDLQQKDFEHYGRPSYLRGKWQDHGWWYYYLYAAAIKVPLGLWILGVLTLCLSFVTSVISAHAETQNNPPPSQGGARGGYSTFRDTLILLTPPLVIFCVVSAKTGFSEHFRYVLPCFPFLFIWLSQSFRLFWVIPGQSMRHQDKMRIEK
jgi:4-amino-4-deoxy-L-arabinose transferase-like glycosyltransferase